MRPTSVLAASRLPTSSWRGLGEVVLRPPHWNVPIKQLLADMSELVPPHQALPVHFNTKHAHMDGESATERLSDPPWTATLRLDELLRETLKCHGGEFGPSNISHKKMGRAPGDERVYEAFSRLLKPTELRAFLDANPALSCRSNGKKGMIITWA